jgi:hypothetical protein
MLWDAYYYIDKELPDDRSFKPEILKYFPIGFVACIEGYFRLAYRDLIDHGAPYSDNISGFKDIKFNIEMVTAIHTKRAISLGEFVSHLLPCNQLDDINRNMSIIMGLDFLERVATIKMKISDDLRLSLRDENVDGRTFANLKTLFEMRHLFCHEFAMSEAYDSKTVWRCGMDAIMLILKTEDILTEELSLEPAT